MSKWLGKLTKQSYTQNLVIIAYTVIVYSQEGISIIRSTTDCPYCSRFRQTVARLPPTWFTPPNRRHDSLCRVGSGGMSWMNEWMNIFYQHRYNTVWTVKSRTVSTGQKGSKSTYNNPTNIRRPKWRKALHQNKTLKTTHALSVDAI